MCSNKANMTASRVLGAEALHNANPNSESVPNRVRTCIYLFDDRPLIVEFPIVVDALC